MATTPEPTLVALPPSPSPPPSSGRARRPTLLFSASSSGEEDGPSSAYSSYSSARPAEDEEEEEEQETDQRGSVQGERDGGRLVDRRSAGELDGRPPSSSHAVDLTQDGGLFSSVSLKSPPPKEDQTPTASTFSENIVPPTPKANGRLASSDTDEPSAPPLARPSSSSSPASDRNSFLLSNLAKIHHSPNNSSTFTFPPTSNGSSASSPAGPDSKRTSLDVGALLAQEKAKRRSSSVQGESPNLNGSGMPSFAASPLVGQGGWPMEQDELELESTEDGELVEESLADGQPLAEGDVDWDFWGAVVSDYEAVARAQPQELSQAIQHGIPPVIRGSMWQLMSSSKDPELEALYSSLLHQTSPHEKAIQKDLARTFPSHKFFQRPKGAQPSGSGPDTAEDRGRGQDDLFNVVRAYSLYDPEVGYVQGSAFIVAALLLNMPDEEAFCVFVRLQHAYGLRTCFVPEMPGLQLRLFQFDRLIEEFLPLLHIHFVRAGIKSSMYAGQWFLTLFSYRFPLALVYRVFDIIFAEGVEAVFRFALALLIKNEERLLKLASFEEILPFLSVELFDCYKVLGEDATVESEDAPEEVWLEEEFVTDAFAVRITPFQLDGFSAEWDEACRVQNLHADEVAQLRAANRHLSSQVKQLESSMALLNAEHCEVVNALVKSKIEKEEMETELIRFKLLYAELSHKSDSSKQRSSQSSFWSLGRSSSSSGQPDA